jgi:transposase
MSYPSDMNDEEWEILKSHLPGRTVRKKGKSGRPVKVDLRKVINGIRYLVKSGCQWRMLPKEYGPWSTVYDYWYRWNKAKVWDQIMSILRMSCREQMGKQASPTAGIIDSQSVKTSSKGGCVDMMQVRKSKDVNVT